MVGAMRKLHDIAKPGEGLLPELRLLYERLVKDPYADQFVRKDGLIQSGSDPSKDIKLPDKEETVKTTRAREESPAADE